LAILKDRGRLLSMQEANEAVKNALENSVTWYLSDKILDAATPIATKKYLTTENLLIYLTRCSLSSNSVPSIKVQVFERIDGGVKETGYQIFNDHRFTKYQNEMVFGTSATGADGTLSNPVEQSEADHLLELLNSLQTARQTL
jgi:hypothetical protein